MIKWSEFHEGNVLYEAFLPEHERESCAWLLRASCRGHILKEVRHRLTWPPRFGPDSGDVAAVEAIAEKLIAELTHTEVPPGAGPYLPSTDDVPQVDPVVHAIHYALIEEFAEAETSLRLSPEQTAKYLKLPVCASARGLFPVAVSSERGDRMRRLIALGHLVKSRRDVESIKSELLNALLAYDLPQLRILLGAGGSDLGAD